MQKQERYCEVVLSIRAQQCAESTYTVLDLSMTDSDWVGQHSELAHFPYFQLADLCPIRTQINNSYTRAISTNN
jgi:hypothetical protein